jgi:hypothetical protein
MFFTYKCIKMIFFFYFFKIIFEINQSKQSENIKIIIFNKFFLKFKKMRFNRVNFQINSKSKEHTPNFYDNLFSKLVAEGLGIFLSFCDC